jgi:hypothetical protein
VEGGGEPLVGGVEHLVELLEGAVGAARIILTSVLGRPSKIFVSLIGM